MKHRILVLTLLLIMAVTFAACDGNTPEENQGGGSGVSYEELYKNEITSPYPEETEREVYKAAHGYTLKTQQGYNCWYYTDGGERQEMTAEDGKWKGSQGEMLDSTMTVLTGVIARKFVVPVSFNAVITGYVEGLEGSVDVRIYCGNRQIYPEEGQTTVEKGDKIYVEAQTQLKSGDELYFQISGQGSVDWNPSVEKDTYVEKSLHYTLPEDMPNGIYLGDVHPFYDNGRMYMFYLNTGGKFQSKLITSSNMLNYQPALVESDPVNPPEQDAYYVLGIVKQDNVYRSYFGVGDGFASSVSNDLHRWSNACDTDDKFNVMRKAYFNYDLYPNGGRDPYIFYDADAQRYRLIGMCYKESRSDRSLVMYTSTDKEGKYWNTEPVELLNFPQASDGDPECPQMFKIKDRWYIFTSMYGHSVHGVGRLSYWIGDAGKSLDEQDWDEKEVHYLDGEDLCAAQLVAVEDKLYMYGWMPQNYAGGEWGGYLNLPREVFAREDGTLGSRIDERLDQLLDRGLQIAPDCENDLAAVKGNVNISSDGIYLSDNSQATVKGQYSRNYIKSSLSVVTGQKTGFRFVQDGREYLIELSEKNGCVTLSVLAPGEGRPLYSTIDTDIRAGERINIKAVIDNGCWEIVLNDEWGLCARTSMTQAPYTVSVYTDGADANFSDFEIRKLASYDNIFD